ncbi:MAG: diacylglycerol kinase family protein [Patescibacteria group bacterium]
MKIKKHKISFVHAIEGLVYALRTQPNFLIHLVISAAVFASGLVIGLTTSEWVVISLTIFLGLVIELINTAIESAVDLSTPSYHPVAKIAKDTAAAAMLIYAIGACIVGLLIFIPKLSWPLI